jgi:hypothetical protein
MNTKERQQLYAALAAPFSEEAIERTDGRVTGKGYSTTGIKYQYVVNRLNDVLGIGGFRVERSVSVKETATAKGRTAFDAGCEIKLQLGEWIDGGFVPFAEAIGDGGHTAMTESDARKGAYTNGFKKAAAFLGVGRQAYEGTLDDDNVPAEEPIPFVPTKRANQVFAAKPKETSPRSDVPQPLPSRSRLTAKQLAAIWALALRSGHDKAEFRTSIVEKYGAQPDYLTREQASHLIESLGAPRPTTNGNGRETRVEYEQRDPSQGG